MGQVISVSVLNTPNPPPAWKGSDLLWKRGGRGGEDSSVKSKTSCGRSSIILIHLRCRSGDLDEGQELSLRRLFMVLSHTPLLGPLLQCCSHE